MDKYFLRCLILLLAFSLSARAASNMITAARVWPAQEYTRIAFEASGPVKHQLITLKNPDRLVLDIEDIELNSVLSSLSDRILSSDPYIKQVRVAKFKPNVVRIAIDLKTEVNPNVFVLPPAGDYKHRLVVDINPVKDAIATMIEKRDTAIEIPTEQPKPVIEPLPPELGTEALPQETTSQTTQQTTSGQAEVDKKAELPTESKPNVPESVPDQKSTNPEQKEPKTNKKSGRVITIAIDAGHGGEDPGARGANGSREKDVTLAIAKKLKARIDQEEHMKAVLIRDGDYFIPLLGRVKKARSLEADLFISIHADSFTNAAARGSSVFALSERGATSASARYLAKKENESDLIGGVSLDNKDPDLAKTLLDLSQTATINDGIKLGKAVLSKIGEVNKLHKNHVEQAGFAVLKSPDIPSILVETAFISNPEEERKLNDETHQDKLVNSILSGIKKYFASNPALSSRKK